MKGLRNLRKKITSFFSDVSSKSINESHATGLLRISKFETGDYLDRKVKNWRSQEINGWVSDMLPYGKKNLFINKIYDEGLHSGEAIGETDLESFCEIVVSCDVEIGGIKRETKAQIMVCFGYLKYCIEKDLKYDKQFLFILRKIVGVYSLSEYTTIMAGVKTPTIKKKGDALTTYWRDAMNDHVGVIIGYVLTLSDRTKITDDLTKYFLKEMTNSKEKDKKGNKVFSFVPKLCIIDQVAANSEMANLSMEQQVLQQKTKKIISPLLNLIPFFGPEFGVFHVGVILGAQDYYVEWTTSSMIIMKKMNSIYPILNINLETIKITQDNYAKYVKTIVDCVQNWNTTKMYNLVKLNCQHFAMDLAKQLGIKMEKQEGAFKKFMSQMKAKGISEMILEPSIEFTKQYQLEKVVDEKGKIQFDTHVELDTFCLGLLTTAKQKKIDVAVLKKTIEWSLLAKFDEVFWMRFFNDDNMKNHTKYKYLENEKERDENKKILCPFYEKKKNYSKDVFRKIVKKNEQWNEQWYQSYLNTFGNELSNTLTSSMVITF